MPVFAILWDIQKKKKKQYKKNSTYTFVSLDINIYQMDGKRQWELKSEYELGC